MQRTSLSKEKGTLQSPFLTKLHEVRASAELCQGVRLDQFTCLIGYSIQYESMTGSSFISYGTNIESPSHQDFRSSAINPS